MNSLVLRNDEADQRPPFISPYNGNKCFQKEDISMFQRNFMIPLPSRVPGIKSYMYKTYTVCASVMPPRAALEMPMRTVSICDHTGKSTIPQEELHGILEYCGMNLSLPIHRQTVKHVGIPSFGDSQYYIQPVVDQAN